MNGNGNSEIGWLVFTYLRVYPAITERTSVCQQKHLGEWELILYSFQSFQE